MKHKIQNVSLFFIMLINCVTSRRFGLTLVSQNETFPNYLKYHDDFLEEHFPKHFRWGAGTASYQVEGGWNEDGKSESIWDVFVRKVPSPISDGSTGDVACDSYHKFSEDVQLLKKMGVTFYRFSISWPRVLPDGTIGNKNQPGINYYNRLINELIANGIQPVVTLFHYDMPKTLELKGGWLNEDLIQYFSNYAYFAFETFGDRVKTWITFNEALSICQYAYGYGYLAPGILDPAKNPYICGHTILKAHALAYRLYELLFKPVQNGRCGMSMFTTWYEPGSDLPDDIAAAARALDFELGWFTNPIINGNYPKIMREYIGKKSAEEGLATSRLPSFDVQWQNALKGSSDFLGINHYTSNLVKAISGGSPGWQGDQDTVAYLDSNWESSASFWLKVVPWGFRKILNWIKNTYGNPLVLITENGFSDNSEAGLHDVRRVKYHKDYINQMLKAVIWDKCNIEGYAVWSLLDNFEWRKGYTEKFGVHLVNFSDPARIRTPKSSSYFLAKLFANHEFS